MNTLSAVSSRPDQALEALAERGRQLNFLSIFNGETSLEECSDWPGLSSVLSSVRNGAVAGGPRGGDQHEDRRGGQH